MFKGIVHKLNEERNRIICNNYPLIDDSYTTLNSKVTCPDCNAIMLVKPSAISDAIKNKIKPLNERLSKEEINETRILFVHVGQEVLTREEKILLTNYCKRMLPEDLDGFRSLFQGFTDNSISSVLTFILLAFER